MMEGELFYEMQQLTLTRPDDWHLHLRDGAALKAVLPHTVRQFARAIIMPNLKPPVRSVADARPIAIASSPRFQRGSGLSR
jgi:dihydroorotase